MTALFKVTYDILIYRKVKFPERRCELAATEPTKRSTDMNASNCKNRGRRKIASKRKLCKLTNFEGYEFCKRQSGLVAAMTTAWDYTDGIFRTFVAMAEFKRRPVASSNMPVIFILQIASIFFAIFFLPFEAY